MYTETVNEGYVDPFGDTSPIAPDNDYPVEPTKDMTPVLERISRFLDKNNPSVIATPVIVKQGGIWGGISNEIQFQVDGKPVPVYSLLIFSSATANVTINFSGNVANVKDGYLLTAGAIPLVLSDFQLERISVLWAGSTGTQLPLNGPADGTLGGLFIYAWTTPEFIGQNR